MIRRAVFVLCIALAIATLASYVRSYRRIDAVHLFGSPMSAPDGRGRMVPVGLRWHITAVSRHGTLGIAAWWWPYPRKPGRVNFLSSVGSPRNVAQHSQRSVSLGPFVYVEKDAQVSFGHIIDRWGVGVLLAPFRGFRFVRRPPVDGGIAGGIAAIDLRVPHVYVGALLCVYPAYVTVRRRRSSPASRRRRGLCEGCGYDLTGNKSGVCPECGAPIGERRPTK